MRMKRDHVEAALRQKGFECKDAGDHRKFHFWTTDQKKTAIWTKTSRGSKYKELYDELVSRMARQLYLTTGDFASLVDCELDQQAYEQLLQERGKL